MFKYTRGDILQTEAEAIVNPVNCEGLMGKGLAYQIKKEYPENFKRYRKACKSRLLFPGKLCHFREKGKTIINFPTKAGWRDNSKLSYIDDGLDALAVLIAELDIKSIAIPPLGVGNGGLLWSVVRDRIWVGLNRAADDRDIIVYTPPEPKTPYAPPKCGAMELFLLRIMEEYPHDDERQAERYVRGASVIGDPNGVPPAQRFAASRDAVAAYMRHYGFDSPREAFDEIYRTAISKNVEDKLERLLAAAILEK